MPWTANTPLTNLLNETSLSQRCFFRVMAVQMCTSRESNNDQHTMGDRAKHLLDLQTSKATNITIFLISDRLYAISGWFRCRVPFDMAVRQSPISITGNIGRALQGHMQTLASVHQLGSLSCVPIPHRRLSFVTCAFLHALCSERAFANVRMCAAHGRGPLVRVRSLSCCMCT